MNQIPNGEYCGECPCLEFIERVGYKCSLYQLSIDHPNKRLSQCLSDKPQILTEKGRKELINDFLRNQLKELRDEPKPR